MEQLHRLASRPEPPLPAPDYERSWAVFLDIDGTLLEFADHPGEVVVDPALVPLLARLQGLLQGAVALISGRSIVDVEALFSPVVFAVAGQHGLERTGPHLEHLERAGLGAALHEAAAALGSIAARHEGLWLEDKGASLALHYRRNPALLPIARHAAQLAAQSLGPEFEVQPGKYVFEVKPSSRNKGSAIDAFLHEPPFAGRRPVFIGDDASDEYGFEVVNRLGGHSVKVGEGETIARWRLPNAGSVRDWLAGYANWLAGDHR